MSKSITIDGGEVKIGDDIGFKDDYENSGKLVKISGRKLTIESWNSDTCETEKFWMDKDRCWKE